MTASSSPKLSRGDSPYDYAGSRRNVLPRSQWSNMDDSEFLRATEVEQPTTELVEELRRRVAARLPYR